MTDLHGAFQVKTGGGKIVFEYLAVIAALFRENKALLQQTFQGNVLLACQRMASGTEKGNIRRKGTCGLPVGTNDRFVQQENHVEDAFVEIFHGLQSCNYFKTKEIFGYFS